ncbi:interferon a3-like [Archocentrus centrarchus]|uniref:interferon a3-like n=1 Tax=Archocentrus centrarchus TaxID=63155 RepID=UPI0011EA3058|nr:interferon a3-like [Archocentrus centrarchus]XP_030611378.1 interferon a3-like [Archocentrus centrarchus]
MMYRIVAACLFLGLFSAGSSLSCRWMDHKFKQHNEETLNLLDAMANNSTNSTELEDTVVFPNHLYRQASKASAEEKLAFTAQILEEVAALFEEDHSSASWEESTVRNLLNIVNKQAEELRSCIGSRGHKKKNRQYLKRLSDDVLKKKGHSAEAWELIRKETKAHLMRAEQLTSSLRPAH